MEYAKCALLAALCMLATAGLGLAGCDDACENAECAAPIECVESCDGPIVKSSCCPCPKGTFDRLMCADDGGSDSGAEGDGGG